MKKLFPLKKAIVYFTIAISGTLFYGCGIQSKTSYVINPDLTGKCVVEEKMGLDVAMITSYYSGATTKGAAGVDGLSSIYGSDTNMPSAHDVLLGFADKILANKNVETWKDVSFGMIGKDTVYFKGTAYFKNVSKGGLSTIDSNMRIYTSDKGQIVIEMKEGKKDTGASSSANIYKNLFKNGLYYYMMHYYMADFFRNFNVSVSYQLSGKLVSYSNFKKLNENTAILSMNGKNLMNSIDTLMLNTDLMTKIYSNPYGGMGPMSSSSSAFRTNGILFGEDKAVRAVYEAGDKPLFNYTKEVAEATIQYAAFCRKSGLDAFDSMQLVTREKAEFESKKQEGTLVLTAADSANGKIYFKALPAKQYIHGYISFTGELSKPIKQGAAATVSIKSATLANGTSILDSITNAASVFAYAYSSTSYKDTAALANHVSFSVSGNFPADWKIINLEGAVKTQNGDSIPFKVINLYLMPKKDYTKGEE